MVLVYTLPGNAAGLNSLTHCASQVNIRRGRVATLPRFDSGDDLGRAGELDRRDELIADGFTFWQVFYETTNRQANRLVTVRNRCEDECPVVNVYANTGSITSLQQYRCIRLRTRSCHCRVLTFELTRYFSSDELRRFA